MCEAEPCRIRDPLPHAPERSVLSLSVGECKLPILKLDIDDDRFRFDVIPSELGYGFCMSRSSPGRHVSTMASRQFTNSSALSWFWLV